MRVYHHTFHATTILEGGFKDALGTYMTRSLHQGVWVSDWPLDENEGADGDTYLLLDVPQELLLEYEWAEGHKGYREFLVPAALLNEHGPPVVWEMPDYLLCVGTLEDGSICMARSTRVDRDRAVGWCADHAPDGANPLPPPPDWLKKIFS